MLVGAAIISCCIDFIVHHLFSVHFVCVLRVVVERLVEAIDELCLAKKKGKNCTCNAAKVCAI